MNFLDSVAGMPDVEEALFPNIPNFIAHILSTVIILILLVKLVYKPFRQSIENRREKINELLNDATQKQTLANKDRTEAHTLLKDAKVQSQSIINEARGEADSTKMSIIDSARQEAGNIQSHAKQSIERERAEAKEEIRKNIVDLALVAASKVLEKNVSKTENNKLIEDFLSEIDN